MDDDNSIWVHGHRLSRLPVRSGFSGIWNGYTGPHGGLGAPPTVGSLVAKPVAPKPSGGKKD